MSRGARMIGLAGALALGTGLAFAAPASAATTPPGDLDIPGIGGTSGAELCTENDANHELRFEITLDRSAETDPVVDITNFVVTYTPVSGTASTAGSPATFAPNDPIPAATSVVNGVVLVPPGAGTVSATATIKAASAGGDDPAGADVVLNYGPVLIAACGETGGTTTSTTAGSTTSSTSSSSTSSTSTTSGSTTSTTAGGTTTTSTTNPNDTTGTLNASPATVAQGGTVTVSGSGFAPNASVALTLFSDPISLGTLTANASGAISGTVTIPATAPTGAHRLEAKGANNASGNNILSANIQVTSRGSSIARTGGPSDFLLPIGIAVVSFGILAFAWRERRLTQG